MVIISVSKSKEKAMLNTVKMLRRLLRKAFLVTNRVNVMDELQEKRRAGSRRRTCPSASSIDEDACYGQPSRIGFLGVSTKLLIPSTMTIPSFRIVILLASGDRHS